MEKLKNIVYLDYEKIYSLSSQLFEGLIVRSSEQHDLSFQELEAVMDGKSLEKSNQETERKRLENFLNPHDYHYLRFEKALVTEDRLFELSDDCLPIEELIKKSFVKIKGCITLTDHEKLRYTTSNYIDIAYALQFVTNNAVLLDLENDIKSANSSAKQKIKLRKEELIRQLKKNASTDNKEYYDKISYIMNYAYGDDVEITQSVGNHTFTSFFIKNFFKTPLDMFVRRYSRKSAIEFTIVGLITQFAREKDELSVPQNEFPEFRSAMMGLTHSTFDVESTFSAPFKDEIFIEPLAMYTEV